MNSESDVATNAPKKESAAFEIQKISKPKPKPKPEPKPKPKPTQAKRMAPSPSLASNLSGIDTGLESFMSADLEENSLLGDVDKDVIMSEESVDEAPTPSQRGAMEYPKAAKKMGLKGYVVVNLLINKQGEVEKSKILESEPAGVFDDVVLAGVSLWKFKPAQYKGEAVKVWAKQKVRFDFQ